MAAARIKSAVLELSSVDFFLICMPSSCGNFWITNIVLKIVNSNYYLQIAMKRVNRPESDVGTLKYLPLKCT